MLSELHKLSKLIWQKKKMLWLQIMKIFFCLQCIYSQYPGWICFTCFT